MIVLALTGLAVGVLVDEQQRTQHQLRLHQEALSRITRTGSMGEFAAALAHEINQPLTAIANYTRIAREAAEPAPVDTSTVTKATTKAAEQVDRAAQSCAVCASSSGSAAGSGRVALAQSSTKSSASSEADFVRHGIVLDVGCARPAGRRSRLLADSAGDPEPPAQCARVIAEAGRYDGRIFVTARTRGRPSGCRCATTVRASTRALSNTHRSF